MDNYTAFRDAKIRYQDKGTGTPVVLLHGYLESIEIWGEFAEELANHCRVISIDLPGFGLSECIGKIHTMEMMADAVNEVISELNLGKFILVGHSMGGYVSLTYAEKYSERLAGLCLLHSTPFQDNDEKKQNRNREIGLVLQGKKELIYELNIPRAFADCNLAPFAPFVDFGKNIAKNTSDQGIIAALEGMKQRADKRDFLKNTNIRVLFFIGLLDNYISPDSMEEVVNLPVNAEVVYLEKSGHMGFIEEKIQTLYSLVKFTNQHN